MTEKKKTKKKKMYILRTGATGIIRKCRRPLHLWHFLIIIIILYLWLMLIYMHSLTFIIQADFSFCIWWKQINRKMCKVSSIACFLLNIKVLGRGKSYELFIFPCFGPERRFEEAWIWLNKKKRSKRVFDTLLLNRYSFMTFISIS